MLTRYTAHAALAALLSLGFGCSGDETESPTPTQAGQPTPTEEVTQPPEGTPTPTVEPGVTPTEGTPPPTPTEGTPTPTPEPAYLSGAFVDGVVQGLSWQSEEASGLTDNHGTFLYLRGDEVAFAIGSVDLGAAVGDRLLTPLDLVPGGDSESPEVIGRARILQSLDKNGDHSDGIVITPETVGVLEGVLVDMSLGAINYGDSAEVDAIIAAVLTAGGDLPDHALRGVDGPTAVANLEEALVDNNIFRRNVSRLPELESDIEDTPGRLFELLEVYVPARKSDGSDVSIEIRDEHGTLLEARGRVRPLVQLYLEESPEAHGAFDIFAAVSTDEGQTWKNTNLTRSADLSSIDANGGPYPGDAVIPSLAYDHNVMLVSYPSKWCRGGSPRYTVDTTDDDTTDDIYFSDDIWGVGGDQGIADYSEDFPEVGEIPFSCVWTIRGVMDEDSGEVTWYKPERLTSGRRDAFLVTGKAIAGAGFAMVWQEDPEGLRPGKGLGPGEGWSGATVNHKTDIWYSFISWDDFLTIDEDFEPDPSDPQVDDPEIATRPKVEVPFSLPVRLTDNDTCNTDTMKLDENGDPILDDEGNPTGSHRYCYEIEGLCDEIVEVTNESGELKHVCQTADGRLLDGDTGASRCQIAMEGFTRDDGSKSAWIMIGYEETKGVGGGGGQDADPDDIGKLAMYRSFEFSEPVTVDGGNIVNHPARDDDGEILYILDEDDNPTDVYDYEVARRLRLMSQRPDESGDSGVILAMIFKEGRDRQGAPADVFLRRIRYTGQEGNPYAFENFDCDERDSDGFCLKGAISLTGTSYLETVPDDNPDDDKDNTKVITWEQTADNLDDWSWENPYDNARSHRGFLLGDRIVIMYAWTANQSAASKGRDNYNVYVRRSFDGGDTWTTDPSASEAMHWCEVFKHPDTNEVTERCEDLAPGAFQPAQNLTRLTSTKVSTSDPRIIQPPDPMMVEGKALFADDVRDPNTIWVAYGTEENLSGEGGEQPPSGAFLDIYYSYTRDGGQSWHEVERESSQGLVYEFDTLAHGEGEQGAVGVTWTPAGNRFYAIYFQHIEGEISGGTGQGIGSDIWFRKMGVAPNVDVPQSGQTRGR